jgi:hypothetical protein
MEYAIAVASIAAGVLLFALVTRLLPVFPERRAETIGGGK